ncbi:helix-turn-helix domain-containing protein [Staphylospora marina]|uniref:helix-turn-helix domain-containing protein n=1 Tax=Staphylospora marina TaxID=2490858 RepID=UPI0019D0BE07|nr:helix-turn-helix domain-containing protein [Staphylospora marina]
MIDIGKRLKRARESLGMTLEDVEARTRIQKKYLQAIENGQFELLPSPIYVRSYIRSYAGVVGENPQMLLKFYQPAQRPRTEPVGHPGHHALPSAGEPEESMGGYASGDFRSAGANPSVYGRESQTFSRPYPQDTDPERQRHVRTSSSLSHPVHSGHSSPARSIPSRSSGARRPVMPPDVPDPEELGITREKTTAASTGGRTYGQELGRSARHAGKEKGSSLGKWYGRFLIFGAILLVLAAAWFMYYRMENASSNTGNTEMTQDSGETDTPPQNEGPKTPRLSVLYTSPEFPDRYELVNSDTMKVEIKSVGGGKSDFEIRHEEVGDVVAQGSVGPGKTFTANYNKEIWLKLSKPAKVQVLINGFQVDTKNYENEKVIRVSLIP